MLIDKIRDKSAKIGVIGLGYVGLPIAIEFAVKGFDVTGFDIDERKIPLINSGTSYIKHIDSIRIKEAVDTGRFRAVVGFGELGNVDAIIICVPTPLNGHREPDMSFIVNTACTVAEHIRKGQLISLESTTYPGTTSQVLLPMFENALIKRGAGAKLEVGKDFFLAFSPEREDPNNPDYTTSQIPKVVGGITPKCLEAAEALYGSIVVKTVPVSSAMAAEATKLLENIYRSVNIALVNELKTVFDRMGIDIWEIIEAASTKPFGFHPFYPGPGLGGHCIPIDPFYLTWKAREYDVNTRFIELAGEINTQMPYYVVEKTAEALNNAGKSLNGSKVLILGASYKKNIDDMRESPSLKLINIFLDKKAEVDYNDPFVPILPKTRRYDFGLASVKLTQQKLNEYDVVVISTDHDRYDYNFILENSKLIVDTRNAFGRRRIVSSKIVKA